MAYSRTSEKRLVPIAFASGLASVGLLYAARPEFIRYNRPYSADLEVIGKDMWRAIAAYRDEQAATTQIPTIN